jgi:hypothetical protein
MRTLALLAILALVGANIIMQPGATATDAPTPAATSAGDVLANEDTPRVPVMTFADLF